MRKKVTQDELREILRQLGLIKSDRDLQFYGYGVLPLAFKKNVDYVTDDQFDRVIERLDEDDDRLLEEIDSLSDKFDLLLEHLGLEYTDEPRIIKKQKKGKK